MREVNSQLNSIGRRTFLKATGAAGLLTGVAGCTGGGDETSTADLHVELDLAEIEPDGLVGDGPQGNEPSEPEAVELSDAEVEELQEGDYTVSIVFHYLRTAWTRLQREGLETRFEELGVEVEGVYGAEMDASQQVDVLETLAGQAEEIDAVVSIPVDATVTEESYRQLAERDVEVIFIDNVPDGFDHPHEYAGGVAADNRGIGTIAGRILAEVVGEGQVGLITHEADMYVNDEREAGVRDVFNDEYPDVEIVAENGFVDDPDGAYSIAQNMLQANPDLDGIYAIWDNPPAAETASAIDEAGRDVGVTAADLGKRSAEIMAAEGPIVGLGSQRPYDQGVAEANMTGHALLGNDTPPYVAFQPIAVLRHNLVEAYEQVFNDKPSEDITQHLDD
ncbi:substrate-binding domain-containing protein [Halalkalicoccus jeotgali]|uniref:ABC-type sugar transport system periplasmic component-like protein n=1 Tax=Halalkalicoccus jeotgali (strain DSM 18796 / CECT 7217 / JCM 14584 / KCTC 4019 / B3) TaxID=795797 RepID=D8JCN5_HALJB|nr:substrate-binding domain-containing protein [Halalkalicoccus jeotgali]ADJ17142.1 ABC-type sugar transport system periplasmic component-like protein [Halalkalicoccus jeotgali B3]ELY41703.1 ABC-type sugar transport system periplasmic component-like protein [Halalkalicoccus jeotgali B3]